jgi:hypothetical protein
MSLGCSQTLQNVWGTHVLTVDGGNLAPLYEIASSVLLIGAAVRGCPSLRFHAAPVARAGGTPPQQGAGRERPSSSTCSC